MRRLPQEEIGLYVPPHPVLNQGSLYKLEQRLAKGRQLDVPALLGGIRQHAQGGGRWRMLGG